MTCRTAMAMDRLQRGNGGGGRGPNRQHRFQTGDDLAKQHKRFSPADRLKVRV
jgi:hypothetical protein